MIVGKIIQKGNRISTNNQFIANQFSGNLELQIEFNDTTFDDFELSFFYGIDGLRKTGILEFDKIKKTIKLPFSAFDGVNKLCISLAGIKIETNQTITITTNYVVFYNDETIDPNSVIEIENGKTWMEAVHQMVQEELKKLDLSSFEEFKKLSIQVDEIKIENKKIVTAISNFKSIANAEIENMFR